MDQASWRNREIAAAQACTNDFGITLRRVVTKRCRSHQIPGGQPSAWRISGKYWANSRRHPGVASDRGMETEGWQRRPCVTHPIVSTTGSQVAVAGVTASPGLVAATEDAAAIVRETTVSRHRCQRCW